MRKSPDLFRGVQLIMFVSRKKGMKISIKSLTTSWKFFVFAIFYVENWNKGNFSIFLVIHWDFWMSGILRRAFECDFWDRGVLLRVKCQEVKASSMKLCKKFITRTSNFPFLWIFVAKNFLFILISIDSTGTHVMWIRTLSIFT